MWALGILAYLLLYRLLFMWYLTLWGKENPLSRPPAWRSGWFHIAILSATAVLLIASGYSFYLSDPWLTIVPIMLFALSFPFYFGRRRAQLRRIVASAVEIQLRMERLGEPQTRINRSIVISTTGFDCGETVDMDLKQVIKYWVLSPLGLFQPHVDTNRTISGSLSKSHSEQIDALIDSYYRAGQQNNMAYNRKENTHASDQSEKMTHPTGFSNSMKHNQFVPGGRKSFSIGDCEVPNQPGVELRTATLQPQVGIEIVLVLLENREFLTQQRAKGPFDLRLNAGAVKTSAGPILFLLWWFPPLIDGRPFAGYELLMSPKPGKFGTELLRQAAYQTHLHLLIVDENREVFDVVEFTNNYGLDRLAAMADEISPSLNNYDFERARQAFLREIPQESLLRME